MKAIIKVLIDTVAIPAFEQIVPLRKLATYVSKGVSNDGYRYLKKKFIKNGIKSKWNENVRKKIVERFETIDRRVSIASTPTDGLFLAEALLSTEAEGSVIECGCFSGGSTAKLSIVAKILCKRLCVFDSFEGLPIVDQYNLRDYHFRRSPEEWVVKWTAGKYTSRLDKTKYNIERYGEISVCTFHKGWFSNILNEENLPNKISFAFTDVDIPKSARECLIAIWPKLTDGGIYFSHDIVYIKVLQAILDGNLWRETFKEFLPILFGSGSGLCDSSPNIGFFVKGNTISAEYINSLTITK